MESGETQTETLEILARLEELLGPEVLAQILAFLEDEE